MMHDHEYSNHINSYKLFTKLLLSFLIYLLNIKSWKINNMHYMSLNKFYDFIKVIYSIKEHYTKVEYFSNHNLFITIYLLLD
jgi:hypothetical protein